MDDLKQIPSMMDEIISKIEECANSGPPYSRFVDCLWDAHKLVEESKAFFKQEAVIPKAMDKDPSDEEALVGVCPVCDSNISSKNGYCQNCGQKISWR